MPRPVASSVGTSAGVMSNTSVPNARPTWIWIWSTATPSATLASRRAATCAPAPNRSSVAAVPAMLELVDEMSDAVD